MSDIQPCQATANTKRRDWAGTLRLSVAPALLTAGFLGAPPDALAQQWVMTPVIEIGLQHIDNPRLQETDDTENITGGLLDVAGELRRNTQTSSVLFRPGVAIYRYSGDSDEDSEGYFLDFDAENNGQRSNWRFAANLGREEVLRGETTSSEIDDVGVDDSVQTGTGRTFVRRERDQLRARPGFTFEFTERTALEMDVNYINTQYDTQEIGEAVDYTNSRVDAAIVRSLTPDSTVQLGVFASKYEPDALNQDTDSVGARLRYEKEVTDISSFFIEVGGQDSELPVPALPGTEVSETSFLWNIGYARRLERTRWRFDAGQAVTPSGSGFLVQRDLLRASMQHQLRPRWSLLLSAVLMNTDTLGADDLVVTGNDRDYAQGRVALAYQMTQNWTIEALYGLTYQDFADTPGDAQEHEGRLSLVYRPPVPTS